MMLRFLLYASFFLLGSVDSFCSESRQQPACYAFDSCIEQQPADSAAIDAADLTDLIDQDFPCIDEENAPGRNDSSRCGSRQGGKVLGEHGDGSHRWSLPNQGLGGTAQPFFRYYLYGAQPTPLFLLHCVFRL